MMDIMKWDAPLVSHKWRIPILITVISALLPLMGNAQSCTCTEYLYVNEPNGIVHKLGINPINGALTETGGVNGIPWLDNLAEFPWPHGLGVDRNGFLYIASNFQAPNNIRRLDCKGNVKPTTEFVAPATGDWGFMLTNILSYDGFIFANGPDAKIYKIDPCTGTTVGYIRLANGSSHDWGLFIDQQGKFYATEPTGEIYSFTPSANDFTTNTLFSPLIDLSANPTMGGGLSPAYSGAGLQGIVSDNAGNIYVVEGNRDVSGTPSRLLKFSSTGAFMTAGPIDDNGSDAAGWNMMVGVIYSAAADKLYTTSLNAAEDCVYRWNTDLTPDGAAIGPVPNPYNACKAIGILTECCPSSTTLNRSICGVNAGDRFPLSALLQCDGIVCEGQWSLESGSVGLTLNNCDLTLTIGAVPACGTVKLTNNGGGAGGNCPPFTITLNVAFLADVMAQQIAGNQTVCPADDPATFTIVTPASVTPAGATIIYQWQQSLVSCSDGFMDIPGANSETYDPGPVTQTTYFRVVARIEGCINGVCRDTSNCVTLTIGMGCPPPCAAPAGISITQSAPTCTGPSANNNGTASLAFVTNGTHYGISTLNALTYNGPDFAMSTPVPGMLPTIIKTAIPNAGGTYIIRVFNGDVTCFTDQVITVNSVTCNCTSLPCGTTIVLKN